MSQKREAKEQLTGGAVRHRAKPPTINDVAELAQVSVGTVSNVLNNRASVSKSRRDRVQKAIEALGFSTSMLAKGMRAQSNALVGLCVPHTGFANFAALADTLDERSLNANFELIQVISRYDPARELSRIRRLIAYRAAGLIIVPSLDPQPVLDHVHAAKLPAVIINRQVENERRFDQVTIDHEKGIYEVCRQLLAWGHRQIALAAQFPTLSVTKQRLDGLRLAVETSGSRARYSLIECGQDAAAFSDLFARLMRGKNAPSVIIASNSALASWILQAMRAKGIRCPQDVSLFALEEPEWAILADPQISCIQQPTREIGRIAWDLLMSRINGSTDEPVLIRCDGRINFRGSVARLSS